MFVIVDDGDTLRILSIQLFVMRVEDGVFDNV